MGHRKPGQTVVVGVGAGVGYEKAPFFRHTVPLAGLFKILRVAGHSVNGQHQRVPLSVPRPIAGGYIDIVKPGQTVYFQLHPAHPHLGAAFFIPQMVVAGAAPKGPAQHKTNHSLVLRFPGTVFLPGSVPHFRNGLVVDEPGPYRRLLVVDLAVGVAALRRAVPAHELPEIPLQGTSVACPICHKGRHGDVRLLPCGDTVRGEGPQYIQQGRVYIAVAIHRKGRKGRTVGQGKGCRHSRGIPQPQGIEIGLTYVHRQPSGKLPADHAPGKVKIRLQALLRPARRAAFQQKHRSVIPLRQSLPVFKAGKLC